MRILLALALILFPMAVGAASVGDTFGPNPMRGGLICDTLDEVKDYIRAATATPPENAPPGCGVLTQAAIGVAEVVEIHEAAKLRFEIARYTFAGGWVQYGVLRKPEPVGEPA